MNKKQALAELMVKKEAIEREIEECDQILKQEGDVGMNGKLVDADDFPRSDIDIYKVRLARQRINCLQNDYKIVMNEIEANLNEYHSDLAVKNETSIRITHRPFLRVTQVDSNSPAAESGLKVNDEIMQFGPFIETNMGVLKNIAEFVATNENKIVILNVLRNHQKNKDEVEREIIKIKLVPKKWTGHGLLGCKIIPFE